LSPKLEQLNETTCDPEVRGKTSIETCKSRDAVDLVRRDRNPQCLGAGLFDEPFLQPDEFGRGLDPVGEGMGNVSIRPVSRYFMSIENDTRARARAPMVFGFSFPKTSASRPLAAASYREDAETPGARATGTMRSHPV
jgi:hypothetical protein